MIVVVVVVAEEVVLVVVVVAIAVISSISPGRKKRIKKFTMEFIVTCSLVFSNRLVDPFGNIPFWFLGPFSSREAADYSMASLQLMKEQFRCKDESMMAGGPPESIFSGKIKMIQYSPERLNDLDFYTMNVSDYNISRS